MAITFTHYTTAQLRAWVKRELKAEMGDGEMIFTVNIYDCTRFGEKRLCGNYGSMKEACEENEHVFWLTRSPQGVYMVDYVLEYNWGKDNDNNHIAMVGDSKRDCYIKYLQSILK